MERYVTYRWYGQRVVDGPFSTEDAIDRYHERLATPGCAEVAIEGPPGTPSRYVRVTLPPEEG